MALIQVTSLPDPNYSKLPKPPHLRYFVSPFITS